MLIEFSIEGGLVYAPGLIKPMTIDTATLSTVEAEEIEALLAEIQPKSASGSAKSASGSVKAALKAPRGADMRQYVVVYKEGRRKKVLRIPEPIGDPQATRLIRILKEKAQQPGSKPAQDEP